MRDQIKNIHLNIIIMKIIIQGEKRGGELGSETISLWSQREFVSNLRKVCVVNFIQFFLVYVENHFLSFWFPSLVYVVDGCVFGFYFLIGNLHMHSIESKTLPPSSSKVRIWLKRGAKIIFDITFMHVQANIYIYSNWDQFAK